MTIACAACIALAVLPLASLLWMVVSRGAHALSWTFLTHLPRPVGETGGGVGNGIVGSAMFTVRYMVRHWAKYGEKAIKELVPADAAICLVVEAPGSAPGSESPIPSNHLFP